MADIDDWDVSAENNDSAPPDGAPEGATTLGQVNNIIREEMAVIARWRDDLNGSLAATNSGNNYSVTLARTTIGAYAAGLEAVFKINATNTGDVQLNLNSIGLRSAVYPSGEEFPAGAWPAGAFAHARYDATGDRFLVDINTLSYQDPLTTRGDILVRGASASQRVAKGTEGQYVRAGSADTAFSDLLLADLVVPSAAHGDILYHNGTGLVRLGAGPFGHFLQTLGAGNAPQWGPISVSSGQSSDISWAAGGTYFAAHGLGSRPTLAFAELVCVIGELGYAVGKTFLLSDMQLPGGGNGFGVKVSWDTANVTIQVGSGGILILQSSGVASGVTAANWRIRPSWVKIG